ncbi:MAG: DUF503 domain-containing protein [Epsilonproteobacteria bacterium]|nr:DUF503 domain-containing protein [Campylobacterota bacterium]
MVIANLILNFELPFVFSLKERRKIINSIKDKLKKFNISVLDISNEYPKEAEIAIAYLAHNPKQANDIKLTIQNFLERNFPEIEFFIEYEVI